MEKLVIIGAKVDGAARGFLDIVRSMGSYDVVGFLDDAVVDSVGWIPVWGPLSMLPLLCQKGVRYIALAIGSHPELRCQVITNAISYGLVPINAIHKGAYLASGIQIGLGGRFAVGSIVNPACQLGDGVIIDTHASVDHNCTLADGVHIAPHACLCGRVSVGKYSMVGAGAVVLPDIHIGDKVTVGAGSVVIHDVPDGVTVMGVPAYEKNANYKSAISRYYGTTG